MSESKSKENYNIIAPRVVKREARDNFYPLTAYLSLFVGGLVLAGY